MLKIIYGRKGKSISDFEVYHFVDSVIKSYMDLKDKLTTDVEVETSSELCLITFGLRTLQHKIPLNEIEFYFEDTKLDFDMHMGLHESENAHIGFFADVTEAAIMTGYENMKADHNKTVG